MTMADDFDGIDLGTQTSALAVDSAPLTADLLRQAAESIANASPRPPCGSEESPHRYFGDAKPGERVRCVLCAERLVVLPDGRAMVEPVLADLFKRKPLRVPAPPSDVMVVPPEYRYSSVMDTRPYPLHINFDEVSSFTEDSWRRLKRVLRRHPNRSRSTRRTDFSSRGVPLPVLKGKE